MQNKDIEQILTKLSLSKFRSRFHLSEKDNAYVNAKGMETITRHTYDFLNKRIRIKLPNDGRQTPMKGHPVFIAEHATATCCRGCIEKWYKIPQTRDLTDDEIDFLAHIIITWIEKEKDSFIEKEH